MMFVKINLTIVTSTKKSLNGEDILISVFNWIPTETTCTSENDFLEQMDNKNTTWNRFILSMCIKNYPMHSRSKSFFLTHEKKQKTESVKKSKHRLNHEAQKNSLVFIAGRKIQGDVCKIAVRNYQKQNEQWNQKRHNNKTQPVSHFFAWLVKFMWKVQKLHILMEKVTEKT